MLQADRAMVRRVLMPARKHKLSELEIVPVNGAPPITNTREVVRRVWLSPQRLMERFNIPRRYITHVVEMYRIPYYRIVYPSGWNSMRIDYDEFALAHNLETKRRGKK